MDHGIIAINGEFDGKKKKTYKPSKKKKKNSQFKGAREMKRKRNENCVAFTHCFWAFVNLILLAYLWTYGMVSFWLIVQFELRMRTK